MYYCIEKYLIFQISWSIHCKKWLIVNVKDCKNGKNIQLVIVSSLIIYRGNWNRFYSKMLLNVPFLEVKNNKSSYNLQCKNYLKKYVICGIIVVVGIY